MGSCGQHCYSQRDGGPEWGKITQEQEDVLSGADSKVRPAVRSKQATAFDVHGGRLRGWGGGGWGGGTNHEMETQQFDGNQHNKRPLEGLSNAEKMS